MKEIVRATDTAVQKADGNELHGHFAVFNEWTEIDNWMEGHFLERIAPGAFAETIEAKADKIRVLYTHGFDPVVGMKPIAVPTEITEDDIGGAYRATMLDAPYAQDLKPAIAAGQMGASFRGTVTGESWIKPTEASEWNPAMVEERTITKIDLMEFGPCTFGAYADATSGMRSQNEQFTEHLLSDPMFVARMTERAGAKVVEQMISEARTADGQRAKEEEKNAPDGTDAMTIKLLAESLRRRSSRETDNERIKKAGSATG